MSEDRKAPHLFRHLTSDIRHLISGPWRAVLVLCVTQILAWGAIFYPPVLTLPSRVEFFTTMLPPPVER